MSRSTPDIAWAPLRATPRRFRLLLAAGGIVVLVGYAVLFRRSVEPGPARVLAAPGFLLLTALVLLADLYPLVPSMRDVRSRVTFSWSAALSLAAVLAFGPAASVLFLVSGFTAAYSRRAGRWWLIALNMVAMGLIGLTMAALARYADTFDPLMPAGGWRLASWGLLMGALVVALAAGLTGWAQIELGVNTWRAQRAWFNRSVRIWGVSLIAAPLLAALALDGWWALPSMAIVIISLNQLSSTMYRSTTAARTDPLTGLANRLRLIRVLSGRIADVGADDAVTLLLIDLDRFKQVNDTHGHLVGDQVLCQVAARLQATAGRNDVVARYGGDEFAVVLAPGMAAEQVRAGVQAFRSALVEPITVDGLPIVVGGSVGVATTDDPAMDVLGLLAQADLDMYRNKRRSDGQRSRLTRATDPAPPRPAFEPLCSLSLQGAATTPTGGWPGVYWSSTPVDGAPSVLRESPLR
ncbi:diguanylate cyclase domain-containing protein [Nakamurella sp.]|uniref:GGDEF domain-containing protein n=1 Tax=Nakamurella sp. TaxID=1869182 RepID=UPI00378356C5